MCAVAPIRSGRRGWIEGGKRSIFSGIEMSLRWSLRISRGFVKGNPTIPFYTYKALDCV
jgi:hypothetical protein